MYSKKPIKTPQGASFDDSIKDNRLCQEIIDSIKAPPPRTQKRSVLTKDHNTKYIYYKPSDIEYSDSTFGTAIKSETDGYTKSYFPQCSPNPREIPPELPPPRGIRKLKNGFYDDKKKHVRYADNVYAYRMDPCIDQTSFEDTTPYEYSKSDVNTNTDFYIDQEEEKYKNEYIQKYLNTINVNKRSCDTMTNDTYTIDNVPVKENLSNKYTECNLSCKMTYLNPNPITSTDCITENELDIESIKKPSFQKEILPSTITRYSQTDPVVIENVKQRKCRWTQTDVVKRPSKDVRTSNSDLDNFDDIVDTSVATRALRYGRIFIFVALVLGLVRSSIARNM